MKLCHKYKIVKDPSFRISWLDCVSIFFNFLLKIFLSFNDSFNVLESSMVISSTTPANNEC